DVEVPGFEPALRQAPGGGLLRHLPGGEGHGDLAVLAPAEALLFGGGHDVPVDDQSGRRVVEHAVDPEHPCQSSPRETSTTAPAGRGAPGAPDPHEPWTSGTRLHPRQTLEILHG